MMKASERANISCEELIHQQNNYLKKVEDEFQSQIVYLRKSTKIDRNQLNIDFGIQDLHNYFKIIRKNVYKWSFMDKNIRLKPYYNLNDSNDLTLIFESRFESGNLHVAIKKSLYEYDLLLQSDSNSLEHFQCKLKRVLLQNIKYNRRNDCSI